MIGPSLFRAQTVMWGRFDAYVEDRHEGDAAKWHGMGKARYRGRARVAKQVILTMIVVNAKKSACRACPSPGSSAPSGRNVTQKTKGDGQNLALDYRQVACQASLL